MVSNLEVLNFCQSFASLIVYKVFSDSGLTFTTQSPHLTFLKVGSLSRQRLLVDAQARSTERAGNPFDN